MMRRAITILALGCALSIGVPALAGAAAGGTAAQAVTDCNDNGRLTQSYSSQVLRQALAQMPADVREYTDCFDVLQRQLFKQLGHSGAGAGGTVSGSSSSGGSFLPTWLIVVIVVLALAAITFGALAFRRRATAPAPGEPGAPDGPPAPAPGEAGPPPRDPEGPPPSGP